MRGGWWWVIGAVAAVASSRAAEMVCPVLDVPPAQFVQGSAGYVGRAALSERGAREMGVAEFEVGGDLWYWENDLGADVLLSGHWAVQTLEGYGEGTSFYLLHRGYLRVAWQQRYLGGFGSIVHASPGLYTTFDGLSARALGCPAGLTLVQAPSPEWAILLGATAYPGFDVVVDPQAGLVWRPGPHLRLELGYPETKFAVGDPDGLRFVMGGWYRRWPEYDMPDDPRERVQFREARAWLGLEWDIARVVRLSLVGGVVFAREIDFTNGGTPLDVDEAPFVQLTIGGLY
ncbi:MAG: hypothetical protein N2652_05980 [Kiritimatiellae bacterium]|nr:hypothetical protein [Kiritimatiellia bacterium]